MKNRIERTIRITAAASAAVLFLSSCAQTEENSASLKDTSSAAETYLTEASLTEAAVTEEKTVPEEPQTVPAEENTMPESEPLDEEQTDPAAEPESSVFDEVEIPFDKESSVEEIEKDESEEISQYLRDTLGRYSSETDFEYIYGVMGKIEFEQKPFYLISVRWLVENEEGQVTHTSRVSELVLSEDRTELYSAWIDNINDVLIIYKDKED